MHDSPSSRIFSLVRRELQEYKTSLVWTPIIIAVTLTLIMLASVLLANRISVMGDTLLKVVLQEQSTKGMNIRIHIDSDDEESQSIQYTIEQELEVPVDEDWDFDREWAFTPDSKSKLDSGLDDGVKNLNPLLTVVHLISLMVLVFVTANYLLGALFSDRKDRSILFWRSMPVSEWEEVLTKLGVALIVAPFIFITISLLTQLMVVAMSMLLVWRMEMDPFQLVLGNIEFGTLFVDQVGGWILTALLIAPAYAWLLLASAAAKRSPFMLTVAPLLGVVLLEPIFLGSEYIANAASRHIPHISEVGAVGFYWDGPNWAMIDYASVVAGLIFCAAVLWLTVYLRKYRWEI
ncbi:MAG: ABC-2 type transport system permease protein [Halieaceae bacterium]|jgi:ABC-2 type transport system permease protein